MLVDDEANILNSLKRLLRREGYRILVAESGAQGSNCSPQTRSGYSELASVTEAVNRGAI